WPLGSRSAYESASSRICVGLPLLTLDSALASSGHSRCEYSAAKTPVRTQPAVAFRPPLPTSGAVRPLVIAATTAACASGAIGHEPALLLHHEANSLNARLKPFAWPSADWIAGCVGSTAPSSTIARMFFGNSWAYVAPSRVPYEKPRYDSFGSPTEAR